jgi:hypothetical protein
MYTVIQFLSLSLCWIKLNIKGKRKNTTLSEQFQNITEKSYKQAK